MKPKVLFIEDEANYRELVTRHLREDFEVNEATTLQDGINWLQNNEADAILLDLGLPDSQAHSTLTEVKKHRKCAAVVIVSGSDDPELIRQCILDTASGYLVKGRDDRKPLLIVNEIMDAIRNNVLCRRIDVATRQVLNGTQ